MRYETHHEHLSMQYAATNPNDMPCSQFAQSLQMALQINPRISKSCAVAGFLSTAEPCCQLHIQYAYNEHQHTSSYMPTHTANDATLSDKLPTNFLLNLTHPRQGAKHPSGPQAYAMANQM